MDVVERLQTDRSDELVAIGQTEVRAPINFTTVGLGSVEA